MKRKQRPLLEMLESRQLLSGANPLVRPDHIVVVVMQDRFDDAVGDVTHLPYTNQLASTGLVYSNSHGIGHPSEVDSLGLYAGTPFYVDDNGGNYKFPDEPNMASVFNSAQVAPGQYLSFAGYSENMPHDGDMTTVTTNDPSIPGSPPDLYMRRYNPMAQFFNVGTQNGVAVSTASVNRTFADFPASSSGFANLPTVSYIIPNCIDSGHGSNEQDPYATDPSAYYIHRANADNFLKTKMDAYLQWARTHNSLLIVTTDEEETDTFPTTTITTIVNGDTHLFVPGVNDDSVNHYNMLRTITDMYGLSPLGNAAQAADYDTNALGQLAPQAPQAAATALASSNASSLWGQSVTFTATVSGAGAVPTGSVTFQDGSNVLGTVALDSTGVASFTPASALSVGAHSITAVYSGDTNFLTSTSPALSQNVDKAASAVTVVATPGVSTFGESVTLSATVARASSGSGDPSLLGGGVSFYDGATLLGSVSSMDSTGNASISVNTLLPGSHAITAIYDGNANFTGATSIAASETVNVPTSTAIASSDGSSVYGESVRFSATVSAITGTATGDVQFILDGNNFGSPVALVNGVATSATVASLLAGDHNAAAIYLGDGNFIGSASGTFTQSVDQATTSLALTSSANPSNAGDPVTLTAAISSNSPGAVSASGIVSFVENGITLGTGTLDSTGVATFTKTSLASGDHSITAVYAGDANFTGSISAPLVQTVSSTAPTIIATTTSIVAATNPTVFGQSTAFTATVSPTTGGGVPTGTVQFIIDGSNFGNPVALANGSAVSAPIGSLSVADHTIGAIYSGDTNFSASTSAITQTVNAASTTTSLSSTPNPSVAGQSVTLTASVGVVSPGAGNPTGSVTFMDGSTSLGSVALDASGQAVLATSDLAVGSHSIKAIYSGDPGFTGSTSAGFSHTVNKASTSTTLISSLNPAIVSQAVTFTATVAVASPGGGVAGGSVTFKDGSTTLGAAPLDASGQATFTTSSLAAGSHSITAVYAGSASFNSSTSAKLTQTIGKITAPTGVAASDGSFSDRVRVTWNSVATATSYEVWRSTSNSSSSATKIATVSTLSYDDTSAAYHTTYYYFVKAKNESATSGFSSSNSGYRAAVNNDFANSISISGKTATVTGSNYGADKETGEPSQSANKGGKSVWWVWTATSSGTVTLDTLSSNFDTLLAVYTGTSVSSLAQVAANDDNPAGETTTSKVTFKAVAGTTYRISVDGYNGVTGNITMHLKES